MGWDAFGLPTSNMQLKRANIQKKQPKQMLKISKTTKTDRALL